MQIIKCIIANNKNLTNYKYDIPNINVLINKNKNRL